MPSQIHLKITYLYAADGRKLSETITDGQMTHTFDYCGNMVYEDGLLSYILNPAGRALPTGQAHEYTYEYFLHDHLGNVRVVFGDPDRDHEAEVIQENHYYPFGMTMAGLDYSAGLENRYLYQGKERTGDFNLWWSDFHARRFDSQLGRWHVPDPAGQFASAYVGMGNNPVIGIDLDGMFVDKIKGSPLTGKQLYAFSKFLWFHGYRYNNGGWHPPQSMPLKMITSDYEQPWWERESEEQRARAVELSFRLDRMGISSTTHDGGIVVQYEWANGKEAGNILIKSWDEFYANFSNWVDNYATGEQVSSIKQGFGNAEGGGEYDALTLNPAVGMGKRIAGIAFDYIGSTDYNLIRRKDDFLPGNPKCNKFVYDVLLEAGASPGLPNQPGRWGLSGPKPPLAAQWANENYNIPGWIVVSSSMPGDVASFSGHLGIVFSNGLTISATLYEGVVRNDWGFRTGQTPVFRRFVGYSSYY